jgi:hypothetical protein
MLFNCFGVLINGQRFQKLVLWLRLLLASLVRGIGAFPPVWIVELETSLAFLFLAIDKVLLLGV